MVMRLSSTSLFCDHRVRMGASIEMVDRPAARRMIAGGGIRRKLRNFPERAFVDSP